MKLHSLTLRNVRAITERREEFPDAGVTIIEAPNETGKSTFVEAYGILLTVKSSSGSKRIKALQPKGASVAVEIEAEMTLGEQRLVFAKRFLKSAGTELRFLGGSGQSWTDSEAEAKFAELLEGAMDPELLRAQQALQFAEPNSSVELIPSLSAALDRAASAEAGAGSAATGTGERGVPGGGSGAVNGGSGDDSLIAAARAEYERYYTPGKGGPTKELRAAQELVAVAAADLTAALARRDEVDQELARFNTLTATKAQLAAELPGKLSERDQLQTRIEVAGKAMAALDKARAQLEQAELAVQTAAHRVAQRQELIAQWKTRQADSGAAQADFQLRVANGSQAAAALEAAQRTWQTALSKVDQINRRRTAALRRQERVRLAEQRRAWERMITQADELDRELAELERRRGELDINRAEVTQWEAADQQLRLAAATRAALAARVEIRSRSPHRIMVNAREVAIGGEPYAHTVVDPLELEIGEVELTISPGQTGQEEVAWESARAAVAALAVAERFADLAAARAALIEAEGLALRAETLGRERTLIFRDVEEAEVRRKLAEAEEEAEAATEVETEAENQANTLPVAVTATGGVSAAVHRDQGAQVQAPPAEAEDGGGEEELDEATVAEASLAEVRARDGYEQAREHQTLQLSESARAQESLRWATAEAERAAQVLAAARVEVADSALQGELDEREGEVRLRRREVEELERAIDTRELGTAQGLLAAVEQEISYARIRGEEVSEQLRRVAAELEVRGDQGIGTVVNHAQERLAEAERKLAAVARRAAAAKLLYDTLLAAQKEARGRYIRPYAGALEALAQQVYSADTTFDISENLEIRSRTSRGVTVEFSELSGGAREQLAVLQRLAIAQLVSDEAPVIIDDYLGASDPGRVRAVSTLLEYVARNNQIIVFTCHPGRYAGVVSGTVRRWNG